MPESIPQIRRRNLLLQLRLFANRQEEAGKGQGTSFAEVIGVHKTLLSKIRGEGESARNISDKLARQIEVRLGLETGWLDVERDDAPATDAEESIRDMALEAYRAVDSRTRSRLRKFLKSLAMGEKGEW